MRHIALFGEVLADIFPDKTVLGGAPYNVTRHLRALQQQPVLISRVGNDSLKEQVFNELVKRDISISGIQLDNTFPTGQVNVQVNHDNAHSFDICPNQAYDYIDAHTTLQTVKPNQPDIIYFGTLAQRQQTSSAALKTLLVNSPCTKFLDINLRAPWYNKAAIEYSLLNADIVKLSDDELGLLSELMEYKTKQADAFALYLMEKYHIATLYVTCGEAGAWALSSLEERSHVKGQTLTSSLVDTVGAGDAFSAMCILGYLYNWNVEETLNNANNLAAETCKVRGAVLKDNEHYRRYIE